MLGLYIFTANVTGRIALVSKGVSSSFSYSSAIIADSLAIIIV